MSTKSATDAASEYEFTKIHHVEDIEPFMGKIVFIQSKEFYILANRGFTFAYLDPKWSNCKLGSKGVNLYRYKLKGQASGQCCLTKAQMPLEIRLANALEIDIIKDGLEKTTHWFEYQFEDKPAFLYS